MALCVSVAIDDVISKIDKLYDYCVPGSLCNKIGVGMRVVVPFSRANTAKKALVLNCFNKDSADGLKSIIDVVDDAQIINPFQIEILKLLKSRYFVTYYKAFKTIVPRGVDFKINQRYFATDELADINFELFNLIRKNRKGITIDAVPSYLLSSFKTAVKNKLITKDVGFSIKSERTEKFLTLNVQTEELEEIISSLNPRYEKQRDLLCLFLDNKTISYRDAIYYSGCSDSSIKTLINKSIIKKTEREIAKNPYKDLVRKFDLSSISLTEDQQCVFDRISNDFDSFSTHLVHGVTGSGKTLVYISLIDKMVKSNKSVIFMVPEISLTPQTLSRFYSRYGDKVAVIHSGLSTSERAAEWKKIKNSECSVIVGTRSSVFSPVNNLGLVIIDEEHELSYKSESSPRYNAKDIARFICSKQNIPLVLGSATPLIESFYYAQNGRYKYHRLDKRFNNSPLPTTQIVDMCKAEKDGEQSFISLDLKEAIESALTKKEQVILFLNRRGAHTVTGCRSCGYVAKCPNCDVSLTYHSVNTRCMCHYCGYSVKLFDTCPSCGSKHIKQLGVGTQLVYSELGRMFPLAKILRMDIDTVDSYISYGDKLNDFKNGDYDIMLGTQMVAKGLDFPNVTLVGVINADISLHFDDFRAGERTFSLLTQVCGRSGRADKEGRAIIQTYCPDNEIINYAKTQNYDKYYDYEIDFRKAMNYPPFCDIVSFTVSSATDSGAYKDIQMLYKFIDDKSKTDYSDIPLRLLYPTTPKIARFNNKYRYNLVIKTRAVKRTYQLLNEAIDYISQNTKSEISVNVNPLNNI